MDEPLLGQQREDLLQVVPTELLARRERQLERGALDVIDQNVQIVGIDQRALGRRIEEVGRIPDDELIERCAAGDHHGRRPACAPSGTSRALPCRGDRPGVAGHDTHVQRADVDPELERVRGDDGAHGAFPQALLDFAPPVRQVATPVTPNPLGSSRHAFEVILQIRRQDLGGETAPGEDDELKIPLQEFRGDAAGFAQVRPADAELMIDDRRIDEDEEFLAAGRAAAIDELEGLLGKAFGELLRVRDRRRRAQEHRIRAVVPADAAEPPEHVAEVAAEDAPIRVELVDDHVPEILEQLRPPGMMRQDARMDHVWIAEDEMRPRANRPARILRCVAVVREDADLISRCRGQRFAHRLQLRELILGERLRGKEIERTRRGILQDRMEHGSVVAERFSRRGRRRDDDVASTERVFDRFRLVGEELRDAARVERTLQSGVERHRKRGELSRHFGQPSDCRDVQIRGVGTVQSSPIQAGAAQPLERRIEGGIMSGTRQETGRRGRWRLSHEVTDRNSRSRGDQEAKTPSRSSPCRHFNVSPPHHGFERQETTSPSEASARGALELRAGQNRSSSADLSVAGSAGSGWAALSARAGRPHRTRAKGARLHSGSHQGPTWFVRPSRDPCAADRATAHTAAN